MTYVDLEEDDLKKLEDFSSENFGIEWNHFWAIDQTGHLRRANGKSFIHILDLLYMAWKLLLIPREANCYLAYFSLNRNISRVHVRTAYELVNREKSCFKPHVYNEINNTNSFCLKHTDTHTLVWISFMELSDINRDFGFTEFKKPDVMGEVKMIKIDPMRWY